MNLFNTKEAKNAATIGIMCSIAYMITYLGRNILSAVSPELIEQGVFTTELVGTLSSVFFMSYAIGQLLNGMIGEKIKGSYMISLGLIFSGICCGCFGFFVNYTSVICVLYGIMGFCLSMIYAPMVKITAENTNELHATRCCLGYEFGSQIGAPLAGVVAVVLLWRKVFLFSSFMLIIMGCICITSFIRLERKGVIKYGQYHVAKEEGGIKGLIEHQIVKFTMIAILTGVIRTTVVFWIPTYLSQYLGFSSEVSAAIFTFVTLLISLSPFLAVFICEKVGNNMNLTILIGFAVSTTGFVGTYFTDQKFINVILFVIAIIFEQCASAMIWNRYCPSLKETGMVSSATGFLDFTSYMAASISSVIFANSVEQIGWKILILIWAGLMFLGTMIALPYKKKR